MATTGFKGIDVRQTGNELVFDALLTSSGSPMSSGTVTISFLQLTSSGAIQTYDFSTNSFTTGAVTTLTAAMSQQAYNNGGTNSGIWTYALSTLTGFAVQGMYYAYILAATSDTPVQVRKFQYGSEQGDLQVVSTGTGTGDLQSAPDFAKIQNASSTVNLSGTTISTSQQVASVSGAVGSVSGNVGGNVAGSVGSVVATVSANLTQILGSALSGTGSYIAAAFSSVFNVVSASFTVASVNQTGDSYPIINSGTYGNNALLSAIQNVQNGTFISATVPQELQTPTSGNVTIAITVVFANEMGQPQNLDGSANPGITLTNDAGTTRSSRLGSWTNPQTGVYSIPYTSSSTDTLEGLHWMVSGTVNAKSRLYPAYTQVVNTIAVDFTSTDRANLASVLTQATNAASQTTSSAIQASVGLTSANINSQFSTIESAIEALPVPPTAAQNASAVWHDLTTGSDFTTNNSIGKLLSTGATPPTTSQIAAAILKNPENLLTTNSDGSVNTNVDAVSVNNYVTIPAAIAQASQTPSQITCLRGDTLSVTLPLMGNITGRNKLIMTIKLSANDLDEQSILQIEEGTGLLIINGASASSASWASMTVTDATTGAIDLVIEAHATSLLVVEDLVWDVQAYLSTGIVTPICGAFSVVADVTRSII